MGSSPAADGISIPPWLNNEFLSEVLSKEKNSDINVVEFSAKAAVPRGNNYLSILYRIVAQYKDRKNENINKYFLIVKALPAGDVMQRLVSELKAFEKELCMYNEVFPFIYKTMKTVTGSVHPLSARCLSCPVDRTLVMEDLQHLGYKMANRHNGLDLDHCKVTVRAIARFHAYSLELYKSDPSIMDNFVDTLYTKNGEKLSEMASHLHRHLQALASQVEKWPGFEHYAEKVIKLIPNAVKVMAESVKPKKDSLNVLNHGDCWTNNMMFSYCQETGKVEDVRFVDFQIARFGSPALDLQYFICNCPNDEVRFDHRDTLLKEYHLEFCNNLKILNLDHNMLTLQQLKDEFVEKDKFGLYTACTVLMAIVAEENDAPDMSKITEDDIKNEKTSIMDNLFAGKRYREIMQQVLPYYEKIGLL